jgi:hypothetical protein
MKPNRDKIIADFKGNELRKGTIVRYKNGWVRVTAVFEGSQTVNLGGIFNGRIYHKGVSASEVFKDEEAWHEKWTQSETYKCM